MYIQRLNLLFNGCGLYIAFAQYVYMSLLYLKKHYGSSYVRYKMVVCYHLILQVPLKAERCCLLKFDILNAKFYVFFFREFYYIQMEKYARQAIAEGVKHAEDLVVSTDAELYRILNLHYNRNNQIEVCTF